MSSGETDHDDDLRRPEVMDDAANFLSQKQYIDSYFEDISESYVSGDPLQARNELRDFARTHGDYFDIITYMLDESDEFVEDLEKAHGGKKGA